MKAVAVVPGKPNSIHLANLPEPSVDDILNNRGVLVEVAVGAGKLLLEPSTVGLDALPHRLAGRAQAVLLGGAHAHDLAPPSEDRGELAGFLIGDGAGCRPNRLGEAGQDLGVEPVG